MTNTEHFTQPADPGPVLTQPTPGPSWKAPMWLKVLSVLWIAGLLVGGTYYARHGEPTVREQTTVASSRPTVDRAVIDVVAAAGAEPIVAISGFDKTSDCSITPVRPGVVYTRWVTLYTPTGTESALLRKIAEGLPKRYQASAAVENPLSMYADAGDYVGVLGSIKAPGQIQVRAVTGCRPLGDLRSDPQISAVPQTLQPVLRALGVQPASLASTRIGCPDGGALVTDTATVPPTQLAGSLKQAAARLSSDPIVATGDRFAYRSSATDVIVQQNSAGLLISATTRC